MRLRKESFEKASWHAHVELTVLMHKPKIINKLINYCNGEAEALAQAEPNHA